MLGWQEERPFAFYLILVNWKKFKLFVVSSYPVIHQVGSGTCKGACSWIGPKRAIRKCRYYRKPCLWKLGKGERSNLPSPIILSSTPPRSVHPLWPILCTDVRINANVVGDEKVLKKSAQCWKPISIIQRQFFFIFSHGHVFIPKTIGSFPLLSI